MWDKLIEFLSLLMPDSLIRHLAENVEQKLSTVGAGPWARSLAITALVVILMAVGIDLFLYWYRQENRDRLLQTLQRLRAFFGELADSLQAILHPDRVERRQAMDRAMEVTQAMRRTEETLEQMEEDLRQAEPELPPVQPAAPAEAQPAQAEPAVNALPREHELDKQLKTDATEAPAEDGIASDATGFSTPRRRRRSQREEPS